MASKIKTELISVRDFLRNFATVVAEKSFKQYVVMKHGKPVGIFTPWEAQKKEMRQGYPGSLVDWLKANQFAGESNFTQRIDEMVNGIGRDSVPD
jgi:hypothetical protein